MDVPAADANTSLIAGMGDTRIGSNNLVAGGFQIKTATNSTERASGELVSHGLRINYAQLMDIAIVQGSRRVVTDGQEPSGAFRSPLTIKCSGKTFQRINIFHHIFGVSSRTETERLSCETGIRRIVPNTRPPF